MGVGGGAPYFALKLIVLESHTLGRSQIHNFPFSSTPRRQRVVDTTVLLLPLPLLLSIFLLLFLFHSVLVRAQSTLTCIIFLAAEQPINKWKTF